MRALNKRVIVGTIGLLTISISFIIVFKTVENIEVRKASKQEMLTLPALDLISIDSSSFEFPILKWSTAIIFFNPDCEHCQNEAADIEEHNEAFSNTTMLWVSSNTLTSIKSFAKKYKLSNLPNFHFTKIEPDKVFETFGSLTIPHIFIYDKNKKLVKEFKGEVKVEAIIPFLK